MFATKTGVVVGKAASKQLYRIKCCALPAKSPCECTARARTLNQVKISLDILS